MDREHARYFRAELKQARENALKDGEAFDGILHVVERLGMFLSKRTGTLDQYKPFLKKLSAENSGLASEIPHRHRNLHQPFDLLYEQVRIARNDAMHIGARARALTTHAIELAIILEDALRMNENDARVSDFMVRNPVCAYLWQPVSFARQLMLANSFSYLPVQDEDGHWCLLSDLAVAKYLHGTIGEERRIRLAMPLKDASGIALIPAASVRDEDTIQDVIKTITEKPYLVLRKDNSTELVGILTPFDML